ncbi:M15 family metallopeptidase [Shewanella olleyana]|uniref:M15 family metallopeptidase n=1 Tax=Shewanella olleyana TaxID=135626 RepID=UPI002010C10C|nr:M15 family metallopeptidase [Shewanella olleyana]MCL1065509.1 M15 family metallopeptidase [Shewanella olleyana]
MAPQPALEHPVLYGLDDAHLVSFGNFLLTEATSLAFKSMQQKALADGIDIQICSAYRSFERQMAIWNGKAQGKRPLLDIRNQPLNPSSLTDNELVDAILCWSALPGASRHHWGTDIDVFDAKQISKADLQLISDEYENEGPCTNLANWLTAHAQQFGFYLPYQPNQSGVSPEPWHLSYYPESSKLLSQYQPNSLRQLLSQSEITLQSALLKKLDELVEQYVFYVADIPK